MVEPAPRAFRTRREIRGETRFRYVPRVDWPEIESRLREQWEPGNHVTLIAPTDHGKTHLVLRGLAPIWPADYPWLMFDVKGDDPILEKWGHSIRKIPSRFWREKVLDDQRFRMYIPDNVDSLDDARVRVLTAIRQARREKGWIIHLNEARAFTDPKKPGLGLGPYIEQLWLRGRPHVTVIAETQRPSWVPGSMLDQASFLFLGGWPDERSRKRAAEIGGDTDNMLRAVRYLREHEFLVYFRKSNEYFITQAPP